MKPLIRIMMQSDTDPGDWHTLEIYKNGNIVCNCFANMYDVDRDIKSKCKHVKKIKELVEILHNTYASTDKTGDKTKKA